MNLAQSIVTPHFTSNSHITVEFDAEMHCLWCYMHSHPRPSFNPEQLKSLHEFQDELISNYHQAEKLGGVPIDYFVLASKAEGVYNLGGDLELFQSLILSRDEEGLRKYAKACIDVLFQNMINYGLPITTISLVQGSALGGGFEAALSASVLIAECGCELGLPEILFNLFPGMGAFSMLSRRVGTCMAERLMTSGRLYKAEELFEMGVVDVLADKGKGVEAVHEYIRRHRRASNGFNAIQRVKDYVNPIQYDELLDITEIWVQAALRLDKKDLRMMNRLVGAQNRKASEQKPAVQPVKATQQLVSV